MKTIAFASLCSLLSLLPAFGADGWMTDFEAAKKKAAAENKSLLIDFTGSDWCPPCKALKGEVLDQEAFSKAVAPDYILVELDFPKDKSKMTEETIAQNEKLADEYKIQGFPTILLTDAAGKPFGMTGYQPGGAEAYVVHLATFREKLAARDKAIAELAKAEGEDRVAALEAVLASVPQESIENFYTAEIEELGKLNPKAEIVVSIAAAKAKAEQDEAFNKLFQAQDFDGVVALADKIAKEQKLEGVELQKISVYKVNAYVMQEDYMGAVAVLDAVTQIDPESDYGTAAQKYKMSLLVKQVEKQKAEEAKAGEEKPANPDAPKPAEPKTDAPKPAAPEGAKKGATVVPGKAVTPVVEKKAKEGASAVVELPEEGKSPAAGKAEKKKEGRPGRKAAEKRDPAQLAKSLGGKSEEDVRKGLDRVRAQHKKVVNRVNNTDGIMVKLGKDAAALEQEMRKRSAEAEKAKAAFVEAKERHAVLEKEHEAAHKDEQRIKKLVGIYEAELKNRKSIGEAEKEAGELSKKAEQLRKKAEKLKE